MAKAYIEYSAAEVDIPIDCKPTTSPTELYQFAECQHCNKVYIAEPGYLGGLTWFRVQKFSPAYRMLKRAKKAAERG